jgi:hypothetical protein
MSKTGDCSNSWCLISHTLFGGMHNLLREARMWTESPVCVITNEVA